MIGVERITGRVHQHHIGTGVQEHVDELLFRGVVQNQWVVAEIEPYKRSAQQISNTSRLFLASNADVFDRLSQFAPEVA